jgi:hypothetical protein
MIPFIPGNFIQLAKEIGRLDQVLNNTNQGPRTRETNEADRKVFEQYTKIFSDLNLPMCNAQNDRILKELDKETGSHRDFARLLAELYTRMVDECNNSHFISMTNEEWRLIEPNQHVFGEKIENQFPGIVGDIYEAAHCLGFRRATAAIFHLMRVMEFGVQKFGEKLGVELTEEKVWQAILDQVNPKIKSLGKNQSAKAYAGISAHLYNVKLAWRNDTMHPKATYTEEEAHAIFAAVRIFMQELVEIL